MDSPSERDQFARIDLHQKLERDREIVALYEKHLAELRIRIEEKIHTLGKLDEWLGSDSM